MKYDTLAFIPCQFYVITCSILCRLSLAEGFLSATQNRNAVLHQVLHPLLSLYPLEA